MEDQRGHHDGQAQQRNRMPEQIAAQLKIDGWEQTQSDRWRKGIGETEIALRAESVQSWTVTVENRGEVMRIAFNGASFGAALTEANRLYNLTKANQDLENERARREREHYGIEREQDDHP